MEVQVFCLEAVATVRFEHVTIECLPRAAICRTLLIVRRVLDVKTCSAAGFVPPKSQVVGELAAVWRSLSPSALLYSLSVLLRQFAQTKPRPLIITTPTLCA